MSASAANLVYHPFDLLRSCMLNPIEDMPLFSSIFGSSKSKPSTPKPASERRASPLRDSPIRIKDDDEESSDYVMEEINDDKKSRSDFQDDEDIPMEQADYDRDSETDEGKESTSRPLEGQPKPKAMPLQPPVPPLRLTPKTKAQPSRTLDDETESDNAHLGLADRPPLPRRPKMKAPPPSIDHSRRNTTNQANNGIMLRRETTNPTPFWNNKFLTFVEQYYHERSTILEKHYDFEYVPEHLRQRHEKACWLRANFNDYWDPTIRGEDQQGETAYTQYIKKIYCFCCYINDDPEKFSTEVIPTVSQNGLIDMDKTITNVASLCRHFGMEPSAAKPIVHLILWRVERLSRLFSENLRHNPREGREVRRRINVNLDGSCEFYEVLRAIIHARNFLGTKPGVLLKTMIPTFEKSRYKIAFVFPKYDRTYEERAAKNEIVPRNRWIDCLASKAAYHALRPDGEQFFNDKDMELLCEMQQRSFMICGNGN